MKARLFSISIALIFLLSALVLFNSTEEVSGADPIIDGAIGVSEYEDSINVDEGKFELFWTTTGSTIFIGMRAEVTGWISLGLDPVNIMTNSDMIFGGVSAGTPYIYDAWCTNDIGNHPADTTFTGGTFDIDEYDATESAGTTTVEFRRAMSTGDPYDKKFVNGTSIKIMWATHNDSDDWTDEHDDADYATITMDGTPPPPPPVSNEFDGVITDGEYSNSTSFDGGNFNLYWKVNETNITIGMKVLATGWVALGISPTSMMLGADFLMGGYDGINAYAEDHYATTTTAHVLDTDLTGGTNDIDAYNASESGGWTHFEMRRDLVTGDPNDKDIIIGTMNIIWGYSTSDDLAAKHTKVGYGTWRVDAAPPPPPPPPPKSDFDGVITSGEYGNVTKTDNDRFEVHWKVNGSSVDIAVRAQVTGYVSIGIDPTVQMKDADMIFGWVAGGKASSEDHYGNGQTTHMRDEDLGGTFDIISYNGTESGGWTTFEFRRNLTTPDPYDRAIKTDAAFPLIWAVSDTDDPTATHLRRGTIMWNLSNETAPPPPPPPPHESDLDGIISEGEYTNFTKFDSDRFELHWNVSGDVIFIAMKAEATGYISIGIDPTSQMDQADMILAWVDSGGISHVQDMFSTGALGPHPVDTSQGGTDDILDHNGTESGGWTTIEFKRNLSTGDSKDKDISTTELMTLIWAVSDSDDPSASHTRRGTTTWKIQPSGGGEEPEPEPTGELDGIIAADEYDDSQTFGGGVFEVYWKIFNNSIDLGLKAQTTGWLSIGFEPTRYMKDADMIFGWVDGSGVPHVLDTFSTGDYGPHPPDTQLGGTSDIVAFNGTESGGWTIIELRRALSTGDTYDTDIPSKGSLNIIWGIGSTDNYEDTHTDRGSGTLLLYMDEPVPHEGLDGIVEPGEYEDSATFDFENFRVYWTIRGGSIDMAIVATTTGWISIGFDPEDQMNNSDVVLGWVEHDGSVNVIDAFSTGPTGPHPPDTHLGGTKDILAYNGTETDGKTTIEFTRKLSTGDAYDKDIPSSGTLKIIWAYGETDDFSDSHLKRGTGILTMGTGPVDDDDDDVVTGDLDGIITGNEYDFNGTFGDGVVELHWRVEGDKIYFAMVGKTTGWVSIGFDYKTAMQDSDMVFGWVEDDGTVMVVDAYSTGATGPHPADSDLGGTNDILDFGGKEINGITTIEFVRKLVTGDQYDNPIPTNGTPLKIIWATSTSDDFNAKHDKVGYGTINIESGETTSEDVVKLWPIHAVFMTLGVGGMVLATIVLYRRKWKLFFKFHMWVMTAAVVFAVIGTVLGVIMVENSTGIHLRVPHSWFGPLTMLVSIFALGVGFYFKYTKNMKHKKPTRTIHKYVGWAGAVLFVLTTLSGFLQALVTAKETAPVWFIIVEALILAVLVGTGIYVVLMGRKKPPVKPPTPSPPPAPPVEEKKDPEEGPPLVEEETPLAEAPEMDEE